MNNVNLDCSTTIASLAATRHGIMPTSPCLRLIRLISPRRLSSALTRRLSGTFLATGIACCVFGAAVAAPASPRKDWFHVVRIDAHTFALSEPKYWQQNVSYLLMGERRALLVDTEPRVYSIREVLKTRTELPVLVIPSHLHFDHVGDIQEFSEIGLLDIPALRAEIRNGIFVETEDQFMLNSSTSSFRVTQWIKDGTAIDLGNRKVTLISTPGHTPDSVSIVDKARKRVFSGDLVNQMGIWALTESSSLSQLAASVRRILRLLPKDGLDFEAHSEVPRHHGELEQVASGVEAIVRGKMPVKLGCLGG
jgi:glyoxylase-like metal-dependent hydrolase (beta-lactamase superfamily II)